MGAALQGVKLALQTDQVKWLIGTIITVALFWIGMETVSILAAIYSQMFFVNHAIKDATGQATIDDDQAMELAANGLEPFENEQLTELMESLMGQGEKNGS